MFTNFFYSENADVWEIMWKIYCRAWRATDGNITGRMRISSCITKAANTHKLRICITCRFSTTTMLARTHLIVTPYVYCLSCYGPYYVHNNRQLGPVLRQINAVCFFFNFIILTVQSYYLLYTYIPTKLHFILLC